MTTFKLLTPGNPKTAKGEALGFWTFILHLAPASLSGRNVCPMATAGCKAACLNTAGRGGMMAGVSRLTIEMIEAGKLNTIQKARIRRTRWFFAERSGFMEALAHDVDRAIRKAEAAGYTPAFRLNGTSDIRWETVPVRGRRNIMEAFPQVTFYDYTKIANRRNLPANYYLTFSLADGNDADAIRALQNGMNVAVVFRDKATVAQYEATGFTLSAGAVPVDTVTVPVVNGDAHDLRFLDPAGSVVALYAKGNAKADRTGFVRDRLAAGEAVWGVV